MLILCNASYSSFCFGNIFRVGFFRRSDQIGAGLSGSSPGSWSGLCVMPLKSVSNAGVSNASLYTYNHLPHRTHYLCIPYTFNKCIKVI